MESYTLDWKEYSALAREAAAQGCVLLKNDNHALPIRSGETAAVFGRIQLDYYKSGMGSGGMVNVPYVHGILDGLKDHPEISVYEPLLQAYRDWTASHPFDRGAGWGQEPWCQEEMPLDDATVADAAAHSDLALVIIGRSAGEDRDNSAQEGSFYLTGAERAMLSKVCRAFARTAVVLNTGNIIDMGWVEEFSPSAVLYIWQGGMEGGMGAADVLCGSVSPSGKLADTIARNLADYPSIQNFGSDSRNLYQEDIYVGYRYFETFARERVLYPFGYGLSYTDFSIASSMEETDTALIITANVKNTGDLPGREVVQVYACPPQGLLGKPVRNLCAFAKTGTLLPGESEALTLQIEKASLASYDDSGVTGQKSCFVLEEGCYRIYTGSDVRSAVFTGSFTLSQTQVISRHEEALAPVTPFTRFKPVSAKQTDDAGYPPCSLAYEEVPLRSVDPMARRRERLPECLPYCGDQGYLLADVKNEKVSMEEFLAQIPTEDLQCIVNGEGMCSPKVTPGTAGAFGGLTDALVHFGIPAGCCSDGPSGIRMDCGTSAFSLPNGTLLACTFNTDLVTRLFEMEGLELYANKIDTLLGPGINIHRCPLNGRNFEYHAEDPYLTGCMAAAQLLGMGKYGVTGTIKHFCANNQEYFRHTADSVVSERALREIYLKPFEMAVRLGHARSVMTSYGPVNGIWTAGNYDLNTTLLRNEWGFEGIVMTDWWAKANDEGCEASKGNRAAMVRAQNDIFMVTPDAIADENNLNPALENGSITRAELVRCAANICTFLLDSPALMRIMGTYRGVTHENQPQELFLPADADMETLPVTDGSILPMDGYPTDGGTSFLMALSFAKIGNYILTLEASTDASELAQMAVTLSINGTVKHTYFYRGGCSAPVCASSGSIEMRQQNQYLKFHFALSGLKLHTLRIRAV